MELGTVNRTTTAGGKGERIEGNIIEIKCNVYVCPSNEVLHSTLPRAPVVMTKSATKLQSKKVIDKSEAETQNIWYFSFL